MDLLFHANSFDIFCIVESLFGFISPKSKIPIIFPNTKNFLQKFISSLEKKPLVCSFSFDRSSLSVFYRIMRRAREFMHLKLEYRESLTRAHMLNETKKNKQQQVTFDGVC